MAALLVLGLGGLGVALLRSSPAPPAADSGTCIPPTPDPVRAPEAQAAFAKVNAAFTPLRSRGELFLRQLPDFEAGRMTAPDMQRLATEAGEDFAFARQQMGAVTLPEWAPGLSDIFYQVASLYVESAQSLVLATRVDPPLRQELVKKSKRERRIGDSAFDRARDVLLASVTSTADPNVEVRVEPLPDYTGIEEGPPFWTQPPPLRLKEETAPGGFELAKARCQPFAEWASTGQTVTRSVAAALEKQPLALQAYVAGGAASDLRTTGAELVASVFTVSDTTLGRTTLPQGAVPQTLMLRDSLYSYEEMARSMNEATYVEGDLRTDLLEKAKRERLVGDELFNWSARSLNDLAGLGQLPTSGGTLFANAPPSTYSESLNGIDGPFDASKAPSALTPTAGPSLTPTGPGVPPTGAPPGPSPTSTRGQ